MSQTQYYNLTFSPVSCKNYLFKPSFRHFVIKKKVFSLFLLLFPFSLSLFLSHNIVIVFLEYRPIDIVTLSMNMLFVIVETYFCCLSQFLAAEYIYYIYIYVIFSFMPVYFDEEDLIVLLRAMYRHMRNRLVC